MKSDQDREGRPSLIEKKFATDQLSAEQKEVRYDIKDFTVELLVAKFSKDEFFIPDYQRKFVWDDGRRAKFIESVLLGVPIPFLFGAQIAETGKIEIIDGSQRIQTLQQFLNGELVLQDLKKLDLCNGFSFGDLEKPQQLKFLNRVIRLVVLEDNADLHLRFELFERINTTPLKLEFSEIRKAVFQGEFYNLVEELSKNATFVRLTPMNTNKGKRGERSELVLRFFAYSDEYTKFVHDVAKFLDEYVIRMNKRMKSDPSLKDEMRKRFLDAVQFVETHIPYGFAKSENYKLTPRVRFEALAVGVYLALRAQPNLAPRDFSWLTSEDFSSLVRTDASNSGPKLRARIEYVRDQLLNT